MRKFGKDKPEFMAFTLGEETTVHRLPLAASLPAAAMLQMYDAYQGGEAAAFKWQIEFLRKYIGEAADNLTTSEVAEIISGWMEESESQGASAGESQASSD